MNNLWQNEKKKRKKFMNNRRDSPHFIMSHYFRVSFWNSIDLLNLDLLPFQYKVKKYRIFSQKKKAGKKKSKNRNN